MNSDDSSDSMDDLKELMAIYAKEEKKEEAQKPVSTYIEVPMEKVLFGDKQKFLSNLAKSVGHKYQPEDEEKAKKPVTKRQAAWTDSDDDELELGEVKKATKHTGPLNHLKKDKSYKEYLTQRYERTMTQPKWAEPKEKRQKSADSTDSSSDDEQLLKTVGFIDHKAKSRELRPKILYFKKVKDLNRATYCERTVSGVQFHPTSRAALVSGQNGMASLYKVDGQKNEKLHMIRFPKFPIYCTRITPCGTKAFFGSSRPLYCVYDLLEAKATYLKIHKDVKSFNRFEISPCGKYIAVCGAFGHIHIYTTDTNELLHTYKQEGQVRALSWTADSKYVICCGITSQVNILSLRQRIVEHSFTDEGCINGQTVELSPNQRMLATGSSEGVVNVYDFEKVWKSSIPQPEKSFMNLRTSVTGLKFNHSSELLAMCSIDVLNSIKLAHFPSSTVYSNFPTQNHDTIGYVRGLAFSPNSGFLACSTKGKMAPLFRLKHFKNY
ncbi:U3 small nucleolar RNA-associated protein 18 homolog [Drosophila tropicalis]|uniref:U3 small nucleolar RNA-associated protein 18 homolog n=1 Tax=Drosophila tropicalis TaxID=46794 RepID=UPI0035ABD688